MEKKQTSFLAKWLLKNDRKQPEQEATPVDPSSVPTTGKTLPNTILVFTPEQEAVLSEQQMEDLRETLQQMGPVEVGQINFTAFEAGHYLGGFYVRVFIRHARDLEEEFTLGPVPLSLIDAAGDVVARGVFQPQNFGTLRFGEARLWVFAWKESEISKKDPDFSFFTIRFQ